MHTAAKITKVVVDFGLVCLVVVALVYTLGALGGVLDGPDDVQAAQDTEAAFQDAIAQAQAEREATARRESEARAAAERRELELKLQAERAEREKAEAIQREQQAKADSERQAAEAVAAEQRRVAAQAAADAKEAERRERDKAHKTAINRAALDAFVTGGMTEECAKLAVTLIAKKAIPAVSITY